MSDSHDYLDFAKGPESTLPRIGDLVNVSCPDSATHVHHLIVTAVEDRGAQVRVYYVLDPSETRRG